MTSPYKKKLLNKKIRTAASKAVKKYCKWCMNGNMEEIKLCPSEDCPLYAFRLGETEGRTRDAIIKRCNDCCGNRLNCSMEDCALHPFRKY